MLVTKPAYYDTFRCLASACPDSCCHEWAVAVDSASAEKYRQLDGPLGDRLRQVMREEDGDIILALESNGHCPMWQDDGLCRIQAQLGESALCQTCQQFPRLCHDYGDFQEWGLELSCPEAARLILSGAPETVTQELPGGELPEYDPQWMSILRASREQAFSLVLNPQFSLSEALAILLLYGCSVQNQLDSGDAAPWQPEEDLALAHSLPLSPTGDLLAFYKRLNILTSRWRKRLDAPQKAEWSDTHRHLAHYFISRYWLQAVSDGDLMSRVKLVIFACLTIKTLGGDTCQTAQLFSKEIENDAENIDAILDAAYADSALTDQNLLYLLLCA